MRTNTAGQVIGAQIVNATTGAAFTGAVTVYVTGDGGVQAVGSVAAGACVHEGQGFHSYAPAAAETAYAHVAFTFIGTGAVPATVQVYTSSPQTGDNFARLGAPVAASISADIAAVVAATWDRVLSGATHNIIGSAGRRVREIGGGTVTVGTAQGGAAASITLAAAASAVNGTYDPALVLITAGTGLGQARLVIQYDGATRVASVDRDWRVVPDATSEYQILASANLMTTNEGLVQAGGASTVTLNANASAVDNTYVGQTVVLRTGTGQDQSRVVASYVGATKVATVALPWDTQPTAGTGYMMLPFGRASVVSMAAGVLTATAIAADAFTAAKFAPDVTTELQSGLATAASLATVAAKTDFLPSATAGAAGGLFIAGSNAATTVNLTGSLSGSVGSVTGTVGSVTGLTAANLDVAVSTRMATFAQPAGFLAATFPLSVASPTNITAGTVASVSGAVGSVSAGGITSTSFALDAISANSLASDAAAEIAAGVWAAASRTLTAGAAPSAAANATAVRAELAVELARVDVAVGSRNAVAPDNAGILAVKLKTDNLPLAPAAVGDIPPASTVANAVWANGTRVLTAGTNIALAKGVGLTGLNDPTVALVAGGVWDELLSGHAIAGSAGAKLSAVSGGGGGGLDAAGVRAAVGLASANLDTQIGAVASKTTNLPAAPAAVGDIPTASSVASAVWAAVSRTLTSGALTAADVWAATTRTLTSSLAPSAAANATAVRAELAVELARVDAAITTRNAVAPDNVSVAAIKIKTDALPAAPAAVGDIPTASSVASAVWAAVSRTLTAGGLMAGSLTAADVWAYVTRSLTADAAPSAAANAAAVLAASAGAGTVAQALSKLNVAPSGVPVVVVPLSNATPELCRVYGNLTTIDGQPAANVEVFFDLVALTPVKGSVIISGRRLVASTDRLGRLCSLDLTVPYVDLIRNSSILTTPSHYLVTCPTAKINAMSVTLNSDLFNISSLVE